MAEDYLHTERGNLLVVLLGVMGVAMLVGAPFMPHWVGNLMLAVGGGVLVVCALMFTSLTIYVGEGVLAWRFGLGVLRRSVPLADVARVEVTRTELTDGLGIHLTPRGKLYNVAGRGAVHVRLRSGGQFLLGSDEPEALAAAIRRAKRQR